MAPPMNAPHEGHKTLPVDAPRNEPNTGEDIDDHEMGEDQNLAEDQIADGVTFNSSGNSHNAFDGSMSVGAAPKALNCAPPQVIRVARFPRREISPCLVWKQTVDVKMNKHWGDVKLSRIPDLRGDWGEGEKWHLYRRAYYVHVAPQDIPEVKLHGRYVVFATYDPSYAKNTHAILKGFGRHIHDDFFIAKIKTYPDSNGWTAYTDMPDEFLSATSNSGWKIFQINLAETNNSMIGPLLA